MEVLQIIDELEDVVDKSFNIFGFIVLNKEEMMSLIDEVRLKLPDELKQAKWVKEERHRILKEAGMEAEQLIAKTKERVEIMVDEHEIARAARDKADAIMQEAKRDDMEMRKNAISYADSLLDRAQNTTSLLLEEIKESRKQLKR